MCLPTKPFKVEREWEHAGLKCAVTLQHPGGHRCGYVRVPPGHWAFGKEYEDIHVDVHGGITFATPEPCAHEDGAGWWVGFDCGHSEDEMYDPDMKLEDAPEEYRSVMAFYRGLSLQYPKHYWTQAEVERECEKLAEQLNGSNHHSPEHN